MAMCSIVCSGVALDALLARGHVNGGEGASASVAFLKDAPSCSGRTEPSNAPPHERHDIYGMAHRFLMFRF